ncbi:MAG TPA: DUF4157 domain-containing protein [Prosthecobacter sp.]
MRASVPQPAAPFNAQESPVRQRLSASPLQRSTPAAQARGRLAETINTSPRLATQTRRKAAIFGSTVQQQKASAAPTPAPNHTGLPDQLKAGVEALSGISLDHVRVHRNSAKPAQLQAHAYAQGSNIHLAPGQEKHLPHEAWHIVQQAQGRVKPTLQMKGGVAVNDDQGLEREADVMGARATMQRAGLDTVRTTQRQHQSYATHHLESRNETGDSIVVQPMFRVKTQKTTVINSHNEGILKDALDALYEVQVQTSKACDSFLARTIALSNHVAQNGGWDAQAETTLRQLYKEMGELSFKSNPILNETWSRCIDSTRAAAAKSLYSHVGGKFNKKFQEVLGEVAQGYPKLALLVKSIITMDVNKEHQINKALGGGEVLYQNLMNAGVGEKQKGGTGTLSEFHKELHRLKSGGASYNFSQMDCEFEDIVTDVQGGYESDDMGHLQTN